MKRLFSIDLKDYNPNSKKYYRPSVRGIIFDDNGNIVRLSKKARPMTEYEIKKYGPIILHFNPNVKF